jgi:hypothetical protein
MFLSLDTLPQTVGSAQFFVRDLAVILGVAAATTVACHVLRQPGVLGCLIATGQTTGLHDIEVGETGRVVFGGDGELACRAVPATGGRGAA